MRVNKKEIRRIGIIGAGFSGLAVAAMLKRLGTAPVHLYLFDKSKQFATGQAYRTPYAFHLLNVRAHDMSAFADEPAHFVNWLKATPAALALLANQEGVEQQFVPRLLYRQYLQALLSDLQADPAQCAVDLIAEEVINVSDNQADVVIHTASGQAISVDQVVFALGNSQPSAFPFSLDDSVATICNPWDYRAPEQIPTQASVLVLGTGLSMIDTILSLQQHGHQGQIYALSRHGLMPLPHNDNHDVMALDVAHMPQALRPSMRSVRQQIKACLAKGGDWRSAMHALRPHVATLWHRLSIKDKKQFLRHVVAYWNIHRHRVHEQVYATLQSLIQAKRLHILAGRVQRVAEGKADIILRHQARVTALPIEWVINCIGPQLSWRNAVPHCVRELYQAGKIDLDPLQLGFASNEAGAILDAHGKASQRLFALGPPTKGVHWECIAVPDIRKQAFLLAQALSKTL